jgi:hypothetical protein
MMRGPVLPHARDALWGLLAGRLDTIERGLTLVAESLDCSGGQLPPVDGLARDAAGAPVLVLVATEGDALLAARALGGLAFLERVGDALPEAVPEAAFCPGVPGRVVVVVASDAASTAVDGLVRAALPALQVCRLEPFRLGASERFAVRWLCARTVAAPRAAEPPQFVAPPQSQPFWETARDLCLRIDAGIRIDGDRYRRRITWNGHPLADVEVGDTGLTAQTAAGDRRALASPGDVRAFVDRVLRGYATLAGIRIDAAGCSRAGTAAGAPASDAARATTRRASDNLRAALASARLTPEEHCALGGSTSAVGGEAGLAGTTGDPARTAAAAETAWPPVGRTD